MYITGQRDNTLSAAKHYAKGGETEKGVARGQKNKISSTPCNLLFMPETF